MKLKERQWTYTDSDESDSLVNATKRRNINGLTTDGTLGTDTGRVFTGTSVDDGVNENLDRVLVGEEVDNFEGVGDDSDGHLLLTVVATVHHETIISCRSVKEVEGVVRLSD